MARPTWPVCEHSNETGRDFLRHVALLCNAAISASNCDNEKRMGQRRIYAKNVHVEFTFSPLSVAKRRVF